MVSLFRKNDHLHNLKIALCIVTGEVKKANCSRVARQVGFCNRILALMFKSAKYALYNCKSTKDLCETEPDQQPSLACTVQLQQLNKKGGTKIIFVQPIMDVQVNKTKVDESLSRSGFKSLLMRPG